MAVEGGFVHDRSFSAASTLSANQFYIVRSTGAGIVDLCTSSTGGASKPRGVLQNDPKINEAASVRVLGLSKCSAGGTVSIGDMVTCTTGGQALTANTTGQWCIGFAESASTAAGQVIEVFLAPGWFFTAGATA